MADLTTEALIEIREEIRATRRDLSERIDQTNTRLDQANAQLDQTNTRLGRLEQRQTDSEVRVATELLAVVGAVNQLRDAILEDRELRRTVLGHEQRIALEAR
jgi:chromosome segregation ATPase